MEIKTKYSIGDIVYHINYGGIVQCDTKSSITPAKIIQDKIQSISIKNNKILYCVSGKDYEEDNISSDIKDLEFALQSGIEEALNDFIKSDRRGEIVDNLQLAELYNVVKSIRSINGKVKLTVEFDGE